MKPRPTLPLLLAAVLAFAAAESRAEKPDQNALETEFAAMLADATLHGTWAPISQRQLGDENKDSYRIVRAVKEKGNQWDIVSRIVRQGQEIDVPIPVVIEFAGDAAIMILDEVPVGKGKTWSARILFHDNVYAGSWWDAGHEKSGIVSGTITQGGAE